MNLKQLAFTALATVALCAPAQAEYPEKPVNFIVPFPPGDMEDILTRMIAEDFQAKYNVPSAVINKPGGGGGPFPGAVEVAKAPADGYTIGSFVMDVPLVGPQIGIPELNPNPFEPIGYFVTYPFVIAAAKDAPYSTMQELAEYSANNKVVLAHFGAELTPTQVTMAMAKELNIKFSSDAGLDIIDCNTFASGDADVGNTTLALVLPCLDKIKVLVSLTEERIPLVDYAPSFTELTPNLTLALRNGLFVHKDTPADVREKIAAVAKETMASERAKKFAAQTGGFVYWMNAEDSTAQIEKDLKVMGVIAEILK